MHRLSIIAIISLLLLLFGCNPNRRTPEVIDLKPAAEFIVDSAYSFIKKQVDFGPRIPSTEGHLLCGNFLVSRLESYGVSVSEQVDTLVGYDGKVYPLRNIIGSINAAAHNRILLCAHWDSRPFADQAAENQNHPIDGANDNASGVAVLLEIARTIHQMPPTIGVDFVFFDLEDQGRPAYDVTADPNDHGYCLGSKYWAENFVGTKPKYGILLDMVGAEDAVFTLEGNSMLYAQKEIERIWDLGTQLGYQQYFQYNRTHVVFDDHLHINNIAQIPCVDIIHHDSETASKFWTKWHTHEDGLDIIHKPTVKAVGQTLVQLIYNESEL